MSKPIDEKKIAEVMDAFRKDFGKLIDDTLAAGVAAPNIILTLEMAKINLAMQYIDNAQRQMEAAAAEDITSKLPGAGKSNIIPVAHLRLKK